MLLTLSEFDNFATSLAERSQGHVGFDFETTGLSSQKGHRATIMGIADETGKYCVDTDNPRTLTSLRTFFSSPRVKYCAHNAKFEMSFLRNQFGIEIQGIIWDTEVFARIERNDRLGYSLQKCAERIGSTKHPPMLEWLKKRGNKGRHANAPREILEPYVEQDAWLSWELARRQMELFRHWDTGSPLPIRYVAELEIVTTRNLFEMEQVGLYVDVNYCRRALEHEQRKCNTAREAFEREAGIPFVDSRKTLSPLFDRHRIRYGQTDLGNASFTEEHLKGQESHPLVRPILQYRAAKKRASSYWENFLELEHNGVIYPSINQNRAATGRMSISDPSCQNWPTDEEDLEFPVRRAFIAPEGTVIISMDYSQMELRLICDEAEDMGMIEALRNGTDFHQQTADAAGVPRSLAKNGRFAKLYGAGPKRVADTLGVSLALSETICEAIDRSAPRVTAYTYELIRRVEREAYGSNFLGRRYFFDRGFAYKYPNYRIQGGCGEILRVAIHDVEEFLKKNKSSPLTCIRIPIHDELLFTFASEDLHLIPEVKRLMIGAHRSKKHLDMDVEIYQGANFYDLEKVL